MSRKLERTVIGGVIALGILVVIGRILFPSDTLLPLGKELTSDDFGITPLDATREGTRLVLKIRVSNHALRVPFNFDPSMVELEEAGRRRLPVITAGVTSLDHGESAEREIAIDTAGDPGPYTLRFAVSGTMGDFFDGLLGNLRHERLNVK